MSKPTNPSDGISRNSIFADFETDKTVEQGGLEIDYGKMYFIVARAGGANTRFRELLRQRTAPHKRAMATDTMPDELAEKISLDVFAETVVLGWGRPKRDADGNRVGDEKEHGVIDWRDGSDKAFSPEAVKELFQMLPDLARDVYQQAQSPALFRAAIAEIDAGN